MKNTLYIMLAAILFTACTKQQNTTPGTLSNNKNDTTSITDTGATTFSGYYPLWNDTAIYAGTDSAVSPGVYQNYCDTIKVLQTANSIIIFGHYNILALNYSLNRYTIYIPDPAKFYYTCGKAVNNRYGSYKDMIFSFHDDDRLLVIIRQGGCPDYYTTYINCKRIK